MPAPVVVKFASAGAKEVAAVFDTLTKKMQAFANAQVSASMRAARASTKATEQGGKASATIGSKHTQQAEKEAKRREAIMARSATMAGQHAKRAAAEEARAAREATRAVEKEAKRKDAIRARSATMAGQHAARAAKAEAAAAKVANAEFVKLGNRGARAGMNVVGGVRNSMSSVTGAAGMLGAGIGVAAVGSGINDAYQLNRRAVLLSTASQLPGTTATPAGQLTGAVRSVASETGAASEDIMSSMENVSAKGGGAAGLNKYLKDMRELTKLAVANGIAMEDMGGVVAAAYNAGVEPGEDLLGLVRSLIVQGRAGSVEFKDFAEELARLGGAGSRFGSGTRMLQDIGGLTQLSAVVSGGDVKGARTTVIDLMREFSQGPKISMMGEMGVRTHDANGMRNAGDVMAEVITAIEEGASPEKIPGMSAEQKKKLSPEQQKAALTAAIFTGKSGELAGLLQKTYKTGFTTSTGEKLTGHEAVKARIEEASRPYGMSKEDAAADYARIAKVQELARAHEDFKNKMAELLPEVTKLIPVLVKAADGFAKLVVWLAKNPLEGLGAFMMASFAKELTNAALSKTIEQGFANITTSLATGKGSGGALGALGAIGTIALTAGVVYLAAKAGLDKIFETGAEEGKGGFSAVMSNVTTSAEAQRAIARGSITPEERERLVKKMDEENAAASRASQTLGGQNVASGALMGLGMGGGIAGMVAAGVEKLITATAKQQGVTKEETDAVVTKNAALITALGNLTTAVNSSGGGLANPVPGPRTEPAARAGLK